MAGGLGVGDGLPGGGHRPLVGVVPGARPLQFPGPVPGRGLELLGELGAFLTQLPGGQPARLGQVGGVGGQADVGFPLHDLGEQVVGVAVLTQVAAWSRSPSGSGPTTA